MKKTILFIGVMLLALLSFAQTGVVKVITLDTLDNTNPKTSQIITAGGSYNSIAIVAKCTQLGGTSDGSLLLKASVDGTSYQTVTSSTGIANFFSNDTLTITSGAIWNIVVKGAPWKYYELVGMGTANDTTLVTIKYIIK